MAESKTGTHRQRFIHFYLQFFFKNVGLEEEKGKYRGAERGGNYRSSSMNAPEGEKTG